MPIIKTEVGKHKDVLLLEFGTGDIGVIEGYRADSPNEATLSFIQHRPKPVEDWKNSVSDAPDTDGLENLPVQFSFTKKESIDIIIGQLKKCRKTLTGEKTESERQQKTAEFNAVEKSLIEMISETGNNELMDKMLMWMDLRNWLNEDAAQQWQDIIDKCENKTPEA